MAWLRGKRTIIGSIAAGALVIFHAIGWIDDQAFEVAIGAVVTFTGVSLRLAIKD